MNARLLLLQARLQDDAMKRHELDCFVRSSGLLEDRVATHDLCERPPSLDEVRRFDALSVGGSGDFYVSRGNLPQFERLLDVLRELVEAGHPTFASCFGYQLLIRALGGEVIHDPERTEVGSFELTLTDAGREDELFGALPPRFWAQLGHKDRASSHPEGVPNLARSARSPLQALRIPDKPVWATQFHPELDRETNLDRFRHYQSGYAAYMSEAERDAAEASFRESPEASSLFSRFLSLVFS